MDCIFCRIVEGEIPSHKVYEDAETLAFLDISPGSRGHTLVIPKQHTEDLFSAPADLLCAIIETTQKVANMLQQTLQPDGMNVLQNNGAAAGQSVFHYHVHLIPRWSGDKAVGLWNPGQADHAELGQLAAELRATQGT
jgi:histidine triad (HIT) family protein